jgi:hypothetical protein
MKSKKEASGMTAMKQAALYIVMVNDDGEVCTLLSPPVNYSGKVENPEIIYDGGRDAILYRNKDEAVALDYLPEANKKRLGEVKRVLVVEYDGENRSIHTEYFANVVKVAKLPDLKGRIVTREELEKDLKKIEKELLKAGGKK